MMHRIAAWSAVVVVFAFAPPARAGLLNLSPGYPLVTADFLSVRYRVDEPAGPSTGTFSGAAVTSNWNPDGSGSVSFSVLGSFQIEILLDPSGRPLGGSLDVTGDADNDLVPELLVHSDTILRFGFGVEDKFEALFVQESGALAAPGTRIGVILDARDLDEFDDPQEPFFTDDFGPSTGLKADVFATGPVAEPAPAVLLALSLLGAAARRTRRN